MSQISGTILTDALAEMFRAASEEFAHARQSQRTKDTPAARRHVAESLAALDAILDKRNALQDAAFHDARDGMGFRDAIGRPEPAGVVPAG